MSETCPPVHPGAVAGWLTARIAEYLMLEPDGIDPTVHLAEYGLDSLFALGLCGDIDEEFGLEVEPTLAWDYPTVAALAQYVATAVAAAA